MGAEASGTDEEYFHLSGVVAFALQKATFEDYVRLRGLKKPGRKWRRHIKDNVKCPVVAIEPDEMVPPVATSTN